MAFSVLVYKELNLVLTQYSGQLDVAQMAEALAATLAHPDYTPGMMELTDLSQLTAADLDFDRMLGHKSRMAAHYGGQAVATTHYVIAPTDLGFGITRMYQTLMQDEVPDLDLRVFRSESEALEAMGLVLPNLAALRGEDGA